MIYSVYTGTKPPPRWSRLPLSGLAILVLAAFRLGGEVVLLLRKLRK